VVCASELIDFLGKPRGRVFDSHASHRNGLVALIRSNSPESGHPALVILPRSTNGYTNQSPAVRW
jgi:hypothetical protein